MLCSPCPQHSPENLQPPSCTAQLSTRRSALTRTCRNHNHQLTVLCRTIAASGKLAAPHAAPAGTTQCSAHPAAKDADNRQGHSESSDSTIPALQGHSGHSERSCQLTVSVNGSNPGSVAVNNAVTLTRRRSGRRTVSRLQQQEVGQHQSAQSATLPAQAANMWQPQRTTMETSATSGAAVSTATAVATDHVVAPGAPQSPHAGQLPGQDRQAVTVGHATGSVLGAIALITGSTVGAGILALPEVAAPAGFGPSTGVLVGCWALLAAQALLLAEVNMGVRATKRGEQQEAASGEVVTLRQMAEATLGRPGGVGASCIYLLLSYSLLTAYIAKAAEVLDSCTTGTNPAAGAAACAAVLGGIMCIGGEEVTDKMNRVLTVALMAMFFAILGFGAQHVDPALLGTTSDWGATPAAVPIIFLALVYHDLVPVVCHALGGNRQRIRTALFLGSALPLAMFVSWDAVMLSLSDLGDSACAQPLARLMEGGGTLIGGAVQGFSLLALVTSFIGTCLGLTATLQSEYAAFSSILTRNSQPNSLPASSAGKLPLLTMNGHGIGAAEGVRKWTGGLRQPVPAQLQQPLVYAAALAPPMAVALDNPGAFLDLLQAAGGYGMTLLYGVAPPLMAWQLRYSSMPPSSGGTLQESSASVVCQTPADSLGGDLPTRMRHPDDLGISPLGDGLQRGNEGGANGGQAQEAEEVPGGRLALAALCAASTAVALGQLYLDVFLPAGAGV